MILLVMLQQQKGCKLTQMIFFRKNLLLGCSGKKRTENGCIKFYNELMHRILF